MSPAEQPAPVLDPWYLENLVCPVDGSRLRVSGNYLVSDAERRYPVVEGMPVMLRDDVAATIGVARVSLELANRIAGGETTDQAPLYLSTVGISDDERRRALELLAQGDPGDPVISVVVGATSGYAYKHMIGRQGPYAIPKPRFPEDVGGRLLDVGCNWGRWTVALARSGTMTVGIDPQLGSVLAARRLAAGLGADAKFVVGDARFLPFRPESFEFVWSYSVIQHFARVDAMRAFEEIGRVLKRTGIARVQMANALGIRSLYHLFRRGFRSPSDFEVRYWMPWRLSRAFRETIGSSRLTADCYFGLGLQWADVSYMRPLGKCLLVGSEILRRASVVLPPLRWLADSIFCSARKPRLREAGGAIPCAE